MVGTSAGGMPALVEFVRPCPLPFPPPFWWCMQRFAPVSDTQHLADRLNDITRSPAPAHPPGLPEDFKQQAAIVKRAADDGSAGASRGRLVPLTCPNCGGNRWEVNQGKVLRMMEERKNLLTGMAAHGAGSCFVQQEESLEEIKKHTNRRCEFLLNGSHPTAIATPED